ncbi:MAG: DUF1759 domain-containing protein, partial [Gammaproteobacteria bacterium]|nr:DUF1759 domain-containing protein [Gammaproteobacteria bacterium]
MYIGPAKARLIEHIKTYQNQSELWKSVKFNVQEITEEQYQQLTEFKNQARSIQGKIQRTYDQLVQKDSDWTHLIEVTLIQDAAARTRESEAYQKVAEGENGLVNVLLQADEILVQLKLALQNIESLMKAVEEKSSNVSNVQSEDQRSVSDRSTTDTPPPPLEGEEDIPRSSIQLIRDSSRITGPGIPAAVPPTRNPEVVHVPGNQMIDLKLPKFQMTSFDGDASKWTSFWDVFNSSIHSRPNLTNALKFTYLKGFLTGKAAKAIEGITVSNDNYMEAVQILHDRFGDAAFIKASLWEKLREMSHHISYHLSETVDSIEQ